MKNTQKPQFVLHWYKDFFLSSFSVNLNCCPNTKRRQVVQAENIADKAMDYQTSLPPALINASEYVKEVVARTGQLFRYYFANRCSKPETAWKITLEQTPELKYFIEVCGENQQIYGEDEYMLFDKIF